MIKRALCSLLALGCFFSPLSYGASDETIQSMHLDILDQMAVEEPAMLPHVDQLWRESLMRNPTLQLALQKLAEKSGQLKPKDKKRWTQGLLQGLVQLGGMGGAMAVGSPAPLLGSAMINRFSAKSQVPKRLIEVTSADLVILAREIENAQSELLMAYMHYREALAREKSQSALLDRLQESFKAVSPNNTELSALARTLVVNQALQLQQARSTVQTYRHLLVLFAGDSAVNTLDKQLSGPVTVSQSTGP